MNILVYEYVLGEEFNENSSTTLINEARLIINHIIKDLAQHYPNSKISLLTNKKNKKIFENIKTINRDYTHKADEDIINYKDEYEKFLILAPEENQKMYEIIKSLEANKVDVINCSSNFIKITGNKIVTYNYLKKLKEHLINVYTDYKKINNNLPVVSKIIDGLGSEKLYIFKNREDLENNRDIILNKHFFQKYYEGEVVGINIIANIDKIKILSINQQIYNYVSKHEIALDKIFFGKYNNMNNTFNSFVEKVMDNFEGYNGFFGIDAILTKDNKILFLEINPRLTTSYIGLSKSLGFNPIQILNDINYEFNINNNNIFLVDINNEK